jgi:hypothetical protein
VPWLTAQTAVRVAGLAWTQYKNCSFVSSRLNVLPLVKHMKQRSSHEQIPMKKPTKL